MVGVVTVVDGVVEVVVVVVVVVVLFGLVVVGVGVVVVGDVVVGGSVVVLLCGMGSGGGTLTVESFCPFDKASILANTANNTIFGTMVV